MTGDGIDYGLRNYKEQNCCFLCDHSRVFDQDVKDEVVCTKFEFLTEGHFICDDFDISKEYHGN